MLKPGGLAMGLKLRQCAAGSRLWKHATQVSDKHSRNLLLTPSAVTIGMARGVLQQPGHVAPLLPYPRQLCCSTRQAGSSVRQVCKLTWFSKYPQLPECR